jgi:hypothetical protein
MQRHGAKKTDTISLGISEEMKECSAYEAWGAFVDEYLAAFLVTLCVEDWVYILVSRSANAYLKFYPNNALIFSVVQHFLSRPGVSAINYGWEALSPLESLDQFKLSMGFTKEPVRQCIVPAPWLKLLLNPVTCSIIEKTATYRPYDRRLQRLTKFCQF